MSLINVSLDIVSGISYLDNASLTHVSRTLWGGGADVMLGYVDYTDKKKINFPHIKGNSDGIDCKVIYD